MAIDPVTAVNAVSTAISLATKLRDLLPQAKDAELKMAVADLTVALADVKMKMADLQDENVSLRKEVAKAHETHDIRKKLVLKEDGYFLTEPIPGYYDGPFCTVCMDVHQKLVTMLEGSYRTPYCPECDLKRITKK